MTTTTGFDDVQQDDLPSFDGGDDGSGFATESYGFDELDVAGVDGAKAGSGSIKVEKAGFYHFSIVATAKPQPHDPNDMSKQRKPSILCACKVLRAVPGFAPEGAMFFHDVVLGGFGGGAPTPRDQENSVNFLVGLGILKVVGDQVIDPETGTTKIKTSTLTDRINKVGQFIGKLALNAAHKGNDGKDYPDKIEFSWGRGAFLVTSPDVAQVPKNLEAIKAAGIEMPAAGAKVNL